MRRYLDPKTDLVFKRIFGEHPLLLKSFLNALLPLPEGLHIESLEYLTPEQIPEIPGFKCPIVDVKCRDQRGRSFIVEMQVQWVPDFMQRLLFNTSLSYVRQLKRGEPYRSLCHVYGLTLLDAVFVEEKKWYHHFKMLDVENNQHALEDIQLVMIELPKFKAENWKAKKLAALWLKFMSEIHDETQEIDSELLSVPEIQEAITLAEETAYTRGELETYSAYWDGVRTERTLIEGKFRQGLDEGRAEGREEGRAEGREEGRAEGREEGIKQLVTTMFKNGLEQDAISHMTGLSVEDLGILLKKDE